MIYGTGIDIIETKRIQDTLNKKFTERIFSDNEIAYCEKKKHRHISYAGHFAAKEAFVKALRTGIRDGINFKDIEVCHDEFGAPFLKLHAKAKKTVEEKKITNICLSISHIEDMATAIVFLER